MKMKYSGKKISEIHVGEYAIFPKTVSDSDVMMFAGVSADVNPVYLNDRFGEKTIYGHNVVHPTLIASMTGAAVYRLLGPYACPISQQFECVKYIGMGETVTTRAEVEKVNIEKNTVELKISASDTDGDIILVGRTVMQMNIGEEE